MNAITPTLIPAAQVRARYGDVSHMWIERRLNDDSGFPRPRYIGRLRFWLLEELEVWERSLATKSKTPEAA
jgi:hypothetical protein